eukprot:scaffold127613_cov32-Tisochrysis_lutea.AAC.1
MIHGSPSSTFAMIVGASVLRLVVVPQNLALGHRRRPRQSGPSRPPDVRPGIPTHCGATARSQPQGG